MAILLKSLVFLTLLRAVGLQGSTTPWLAQRLAMGQAAAEPHQSSGRQPLIPSSASCCVETRSILGAWVNLKS